MKTLFQGLAMGICFVCLFIAGTATPASIAYGIHLWGGEGHELGYSAWEAVKNWALMLSAILPAGVAYLAIK